MVREASDKLDNEILVYGPVLDSREEAVALENEMTSSTFTSSDESIYCSEETPEAPDCLMGAEPNKLFAPLDSTPASHVETELAKLNRLIQAGDVAAASVQLDITEAAYQKFAELDLHMASERRYLVRDLAHARAQLAMRSGDGKNAFHEIKSTLDVTRASIKGNPDDVKSYEVLGCMNHRLGNYREARDAFGQAAIVDECYVSIANAYDQQLAQLLEETTAQREAATGLDDPTVVLPLLNEEIKLNRALGNKAKADALAKDFQSYSRRLAIENFIIPLTESANASELSQDDLGEYSAYVSIVADADGYVTLELADGFNEIDSADQLSILRGVQKQLMTAHHRRSITTARHATVKRYHEARVAMLENDMPRAMLAYMDVNNATKETEDPELLRLRSEAREILSQHTIQYIDKLLGQNAMLHDDRSNHAIGWGLSADITNEGLKTTLYRLKANLGAEKCATLDEAIREFKVDHRGFFPEDPDFNNLLGLWTYEGLAAAASQTDGRRVQILELAESLNRGDGSYQVSAELLAELFGKDIDTIKADVLAREGDEIAKDVRVDSDFSKSEVRERLEEELKTLKETKPKLFKQRYPGGKPSDAEMKAMVEMTIQGEIDRRILKRSFEFLEAKVESGQTDELTKKAWTLYEDMKDPMDRVWNISHETRYLIYKEVVMTVVTLPASMGAGALVRAGVGSIPFVARASAQGGVRGFIARGTVLTAGAVTEAYVSEGQQALLTGRFSHKNAGMDFLMSFAFHGGGSAWKALGKKAGLEKAIKGSAGMRRVALQSADGAGMFAVQVQLATTSTYLTEVMLGHSDASTYWERLGASTIRMAGYSVIGRVTKNALPNQMEAQMWERMQYSRELYRKTADADLAVAPNYSHFKAGQYIDLPLSHVVPTQEVVFRAQVDAYRNNQISSEIPEVVIIDGIPYVENGHHRLYAAYRKGHAQQAVVRVRVAAPDPDADGMVPVLDERATRWHKIVIRPSNEIYPSQKNDANLNRFGAHYYKDANFYNSLTTATKVGDNFYYPILPGIKGHVAPTHNGGSVEFTGRVFGQGSAATVYEGVMTSPHGEKRIVAIKVRDHGFATPAQIANETNLLELAQNSDLGNVEFLGMTRVMDRPGIITNVADGAHWEKVDGHWITEHTVVELLRLHTQLIDLGLNPGDLQFMIANPHMAANKPLVSLIDAEGLHVPHSSKPYSWRQALGILSRRRAESGLPSRDIDVFEWFHARNPIRRSVSAKDLVTNSSLSDRSDLATYLILNKGWSLNAVQELVGPHVDVKPGGQRAVIPSGTKSSRPRFVDGKLIYPDDSDAAVDVRFGLRNVNRIDPNTPLREQLSYLSRSASIEVIRYLVLEKSWTKEKLAQWFDPAVIQDIDQSQPELFKKTG